jgi:Tol biopolymer transport system component
MNEPMDRVFADWLREGPESGPGAGLTGALAATRRTGQRPGWTLPERWLPVQLTMTRTPLVRPLLAIIMLALLSAALVATVLFAASQRRQPLPPPFGPARNGAVVYAQDGDLFIADELNGTPRPLVTGPDVDSDPVFSRQGDRIAFVRGVRLMTVSPDGSDLIELASLEGSVEGIDWSPDGSALLVKTYLPGGQHPGLKIIQSDGSGSRILADQGSGSWRPDGRHIAVMGRGGGAYIVDADGTNLRELPVGGSGLEWSPDGKHLSFLIPATAPPTGISIADIAEDGSVTDVRQLELVPWSILWSDPRWSPDGRQLAFVLRIRWGSLLSDSALRVVIANADGSGFQLVGKEVYEHRVIDYRAIDLNWAPDGRSLVIFDHPMAQYQRLPGLDGLTADPDTPFAPGAQVWSVDVATGEQTEVGTPVESWQRLAP